MQMQLAIYDPNSGVLLADWSTKVRSCNVTTGAHGYESCEADLNIPFYEAFLYYQQLGPLELRVSWGGYRVWEGRLEDPTQFAHSISGLKITAFGGWVAFNDAPYTALWSDTRVDIWRPILNREAVSGAFVPDRYTFNTQNQLYIAPQKNATLGTTGVLKLGALVYVIPDQSARNIVGVSFDYKMVVPAANWRALFSTRNPDFSGVGNHWTLTSAAGGTLVGSVNVTFTGASVVNFSLDFNAADAVYTGESGATYLQITNVRLVTSTVNRINTTLGTNIAAGTRTVTPASMARIFVGQRLFIDQGSTTVSESVVVTAITSTTFTAVFAFAHIVASTVTAHIVYPDEIIDDCVTTLNALNATQVNADLGSIQSQAIDIDQAIYEDQYPTDIINDLIAKSDDQTPPRQWVAMVYNNQTLIVRPRGSGYDWFTDITSLDVVRTLTQLYNSVYAVYKEPNDQRSLRTAVTTDADSVAKFKITRRKPILVETTDSVQATKIRDSVLALQTDPVPRANVELDRIYDKFGNPFPLFMVRADDTLTLRNLPPTLGNVYDKIRTLVIVRTNVDLLRNTIQLDLESATPNIEVQLAKALKGN